MLNDFTIDTRSETWRAIEKWANERLDVARRKNDGALDAEKTAHLRGRIAELKDLLTLASPAPAINVDE